MPSSADRVHLDRSRQPTLQRWGNALDTTTIRSWRSAPGKVRASTLRDNSKGFAAQYTAVLRPI